MQNSNTNDNLPLPFWIKLVTSGLLTVYFYFLHRYSILHVGVSGRVSAFQSWGQPSDCFYLCDPFPDTEGWPPGSAPAPGIAKRWETALTARAGGQRRISLQLQLHPMLLYVEQFINVQDRGSSFSAANKRFKIRTNFHILLLILLCLDWELFLWGLHSSSWDCPASDTRMLSHVHGCNPLQRHTESNILHRADMSMAAWVHYSYVSFLKNIIKIGIILP